MKRQDIAAAFAFAVLCAGYSVCARAALRMLGPAWGAVFAAAGLCAVVFCELVLERAARKKWQRSAPQLLARIAPAALVLFAAAAGLCGVRQGAGAALFAFAAFCGALVAALALRGAVALAEHAAHRALAARCALVCTPYTVETRKLRPGQTLRLAVVSDLHGCLYGPRQEALAQAVAREKPDAVLLPGDLFDRRAPQSTAVCAVRRLCETAPCFFSTGNHDLRDFDGDESRALAARAGASVLAGGGRLLAARGAAVLVCGTDDPDCGDDALAQQLARAGAAAKAHPDAFCVLLQHRPNAVPACAPQGFDLIVSGHAHGGQWAFPFLPQGVYAPDQGLFPRCTAGLFSLAASGGKRAAKPQALGATARAAQAPVLAVSRGLAKETVPLPRFGNPAEVLLLTVRGVC